MTGYAEQALQMRGEREILPATDVRGERNALPREIDRAAEADAAALEPAIRAATRARWLRSAPASIRGRLRIGRTDSRRDHASPVERRDGELGAADVDRQRGHCGHGALRQHLSGEAVRCPSS